jgi:uncharacterized protein (DUF1330 family)
LKPKIAVAKDHNYHRRGCAIVHLPTYRQWGGSHESSIYGRVGNAHWSSNWRYGSPSLHAQAKPKAYQVTELEVIDDAANKVFAPLVAASQKAAGGRNLQTNGGKIVAFVGDAPKRISITEWDSLDQAVAWRNGNGWKDLSPQRDKAIKILRQFFVEATN